MAAPPITPSKRFSARGVSKCYFVPSIASISAPTRAELDAGTDLSPQVADIDGWTVQSEQIETPDLGSTFTSKIPGSTSADDSSLTMYTDLGGADVRTLLPRGTDGFIVWLDGGDVAGRKMDVFPIRVASLGKKRTTDDDAETIDVGFSITAEPAENVTIP
ncbi:phage tail tube protein [Actinomadura harenae]|uniref:Phage tail protein n=1 Tax=Actinomadura harenae TaxID=2483351 RepID=A0A3M2LR60_9ACTN|nr:hypothetical protein [Actinomadura harenae]RMI39877.1 hypothetical protein EBO15_28330 [Actinomadura harenae]